MKKFTKVSLITAAVAAAIGIVCLLTAIFMGLTWGSFVGMVRNGEFTVGSIGRFRIFPFGGYNTLVDSDLSESYLPQSFSADECRNLKVEVGAGDLQIYYDDVDKIEVYANGAVGFETKMNGNTLKIESGIGVNSARGTIEVVLPEDTELDKVDLDIGAGSAEVYDLNAREIDAEVGAGQLTMTLVGEESDYNYKIDCAVGQVTIGESSYGGIATTRRVDNDNASRKVDVECGAGQIDISF